MAISDSEKVDFLWKRILFGVTKTASAADKGGSNETIGSSLPVYPDAIWADAGDIPATPPTEDASDSVVAVLTGSARIRLTGDPTAPANVAWLACQSYGDPDTLFGEFISPGAFGSGYAVKVWIGDPNVGPAARIFPDTTGEEWVFDYQAGVLVFTGAIPSNKPATIGSGNVSTASSGIYVEVYRYIGRKGAGSPGNDNLGSMASQNADNVQVTGGELSNVTLTNVTVDGGWF